MGFLNNKNEWECQDPCLTSKNGQLCGKTDHFTNFALLLTGANSQKNNDPCASSVSPDFVLAYISLSLVAMTICITIISVIIIEIRIRILRLRKKQNEGIVYIQYDE